MILHFWHFYTGVIFHGNTQWWRKSQHFKESQENLAAQHRGTSSPPGGRAPTEWFSELGTAAAPDRPTPLHPHYTASRWRAERSDTCQAGDPTINVTCHRFLFVPFWMNSSKNLTKLIQEILIMWFKSIKHLASNMREVPLPFISSCLEFAIIIKCKLSLQSPKISGRDVNLLMDLGKYHLRDLTALAVFTLTYKFWHLSILLTSHAHNRCQTSITFSYPAKCINCQNLVQTSHHAFVLWKKKAEVMAWDLSCQCFSLLKYRCKQ